METINPHARQAHTFVLVHGAWHGGWCWRFVMDRLIARGHRAFAPTLGAALRRAASICGTRSLRNALDRRQ